MVLGERQQSENPLDPTLIVVAVVTLQVTLAVMLLSIIPAASVLAENVFALFLGVELISFSIVSYIYRMEKNKRPLHGGWIIVGLCVIFFLLVATTTIF